MIQDKSTLRRVWTAMLFTRDVISILLLLLALCSFGLMLFAIKSALPSPPVVEPHSTLVVDLSMPVVEGYQATALPAFIQKAISKKPEDIRLYDVINGIALAANDPKIVQIAVVAPAPGQIGLAQARELAAAIEKFKKDSGKPVLAYGLSPTQSQYLIMAAADQVYLDPQGSVMIEGIASYRPYFRSALVDKLGVDVHLFKVGEYKSAAEPFIRDNESEASREASLFWMNDIWTRYLEDLAKLRKMDADQLRAQANNLAQDIANSSGDLAQFALSSGLVDGLMTDMEFHNKLSEMGRLDPKTLTAVRISLPDYASSRSSAFNRPQIAVVPIEGEIIDGDPSSGRASAPEVVHRLREVNQDPNIKAVVVRINSPGGSVLGSELIRREVARLVDSGRPVVVSMGNVSASGGYWIATASDTIIADESTITGSIGIFGLLPNFTRALDKIGVHTDGSSTAPMAGAMDPTRPISKETAAAIQKIIDNGYEKFLTRVSTARDMTMEEADRVAQGRVWTGSQASERGLVDRQGGLMTAIVAAARQAQLPTNATVAIVDGQSTRHSFNNSPQWTQQIVRQAVGIKTPLEYMGVSTPAWLEQSMEPNASIQSRAYAHCLCVP